MKLFTKVISVMDHYVHAGYKRSKIHCGGHEELLAGTGQGNRFSGDMCRDILCLIIKQIERKSLGVIIEAPISKI